MLDDWTVVRVRECTNLVDGVVAGEVKGVCVSGLTSTSSRLHLLLLLFQHHL